MENLFEPSDFEASIDLVKEIEKVKAESGLNYIECVVEVCEIHGLDIETVSDNLSDNIKQKIEADALDLNLLNYKVNTLI